MSSINGILAASHDCSLDKFAYPTYAVGVAGDSYDEDYDTCYGITCSYSYGYFWVSATAIHTLAQTLRIDRVKARVKAYASGGGVDPCGVTVTIAYKSGGSWTNLYTDTQNGGTVSIDYTYDNSTGWSNVTDLKIYAYACAYCASEFESADIQAYLYDIQAWYTSYSDSGLRIRKSASTESIGMETLSSSHKLRFRKGSTTYGIPLVATTDPYATGIRIYDGSAVKALVKKTP